MSQEDYELYKKLYSVKQILQEKFYDRINGRKPTICSDDALRLFVKYKPMTLTDMANINGIGDSFIENYGNYFLAEIKKFTAVEGVEINDNEKIILSKLENRLVNINKRNRLLYSGKVNKDYGFDLYKFINNIDELENFILTRDIGGFRIIDIKDFDDDKFKAILKLMRQVAKIETESGNYELYIAYPFVQGKTENENFNIKAPLILFPVKLERYLDKIVLKNDFSRDILYNTNLILANNKFNGKNEVLPDNAIEEFNQENYIEDMLKFYKDNNFYIQYSDCNLEKFLENRVGEFPNYKNGELEIKKYMVLGIYSMYVTSMYEDFHKMIQDNDVTKLIKELLWGIESNLGNFDVQYDEYEEKNQPLKTIESEINYINELDFSQEKVLKEINSCDSIVVQGPPGTGKSQTITSIISQCILQGKKVLMVSEKKTALDVIYSRLGNLSKFSILIDDVENKTTFYEQLNSIIDTMNNNYELLYSFDNLKAQAIELIKNRIATIDYDLNCLDIIAQKVYGINDFGTSMYNIYNVCKRINIADQTEIDAYNFINQILTDNIKNLTYPVLTKTKDLFKEEDTALCIDNYLNIININEIVALIKPNLVEIEIIELVKKVNDLEIFLNDYNNMPFYKKMLEKSKLKAMLNDIISNYFLENSNALAKQLVGSIAFLKSFLPSYQVFMANKFLYDKLTYYEKEYVKLIEKVKKIKTKKYILYKQF